MSQQKRKWGDAAESRKWDDLRLHLRDVRGYLSDRAETAERVQLIAVLTEWIESPSLDDNCDVSVLAPYFQAARHPFSLTRLWMKSPEKEEEEKTTTEPPKDYYRMLDEAGGAARVFRDDWFPRLCESIPTVGPIKLRWEGRPVMDQTGHWLFECLRCRSEEYEYILVFNPVDRLLYLTNEADWVVVASVSDVNWIERVRRVLNEIDTDYVLQV